MREMPGKKGGDLMCTALWTEMGTSVAVKQKRAALCPVLTRVNKTWGYR